MKPIDEINKMTKSEKINYLLEVSQDRKEACIVREIAKLKAALLL